ncbi:MAG: MBL fold metallo-hydrolase [Patescibacteria group bacterium]|nr:MBL fold metallo-hydrolase [Patescibacteria group bacterium]
MNNNNKKNTFWLIATLSFLNIIAWIVVYNLSRQNLLEVSFFDVGQGDSIFIETPKGYQILIDGGPSLAVLEKLGNEMPFWDRKIDMIILTHPEHDHIFGLLEVLKKYKVDFILWTGVLRDTAEYEEWKRLIGSGMSNVKVVKAGQRIITPKTIINILYPFEDLEGKIVKNTNNTSIVSRLVFGNTSFIFTGDAYKSVEREIANGELYVESDILKIGHHGSKTSTSKELLEEVKPEIAVISVGKLNKYGHPHFEVLEALDKYDIRVLRTDQYGDIKIVSDGKKLTIHIK